MVAVIGILPACADDTPTTAVARTTTSLGSTSSAQPKVSSPEASALSLVVIGDSLPFGGHLCGGCRDVGQIYGEMVEADSGTKVNVTNMSSDRGINSKQLLQAVRTDDAMRSALAGADIVVVSSGHNDTPWNVVDDPCDGPLIEDNSKWASFTPECSAAAATQYRPILDGVLEEIDALRKGKPTAVRVLNFYNDLIGWPAAPPGSEAASVNVLDAFNPVICETAVAHGAACIDVYHAFNGSDGRQTAGALLGPDFTHPNQAGHQRMAELLRRAGIAPL